MLKVKRYCKHATMYLYKITVPTCNDNTIGVCATVYSNGEQVYCTFMFYFFLGTCNC